MTATPLTSSLRRAVVLVGTTAVLVLVGCNTANTASSAHAGPAGLGSNTSIDRIVTNGWLNHKANVVGVRESTVNDNLKRVAVDVYSDQSTLQRFSYKFEWFDAAGIPVISPTGSLTSVSIHPKETITLTSIAGTTAASQWRLTFIDQQH